jgi:hypothetical protein
VVAGPVFSFPYSLKAEITDKLVQQNLFGVRAVGRRVYCFDSDGRAQSKWTTGLLPIWRAAWLRLLRGRLPLSPSSVERKLTDFHA